MLAFLPYTSPVEAQAGPPLLLQPQMATGGVYAPWQSLAIDAIVDSDEVQNYIRAVLTRAC